MFKKILYINSLTNDFLSDSFLLGLKEIYNENTFEFPINLYIYKMEVIKNKSTMHGIGFTLYNILDATKANLYEESKINLNDFDLFIFSDIYRQKDIYLKLLKYLNFSNTFILDGEDTAALYPYYFAPWKKPYSLTFPIPHKKFTYFKRELQNEKTLYYLYFKLTKILPKFLLSKINLPKNVFPISFSIPEQKIIKTKCTKTKLFPKHIVDEEVLKYVKDSVSNYAFNNEIEYYEDLQKSKFGITLKRGGWDCLRHYEIAANGAVICFKNLYLKPNLCAPHGLIDGFNCIDYSSYKNLISKIENISEFDYERLQNNSLDWVRNNTCKELVIRTFLNFQINRNKKLK